MRSSLRKSSLFLLCLSLVWAVPNLIANKKVTATAPATNEQRRAAHALNRLAFGPRPGDVQQVMAMGVDRWIDLQLHPEKLSDDALQSRLTALRTLHMNAHELVEQFPDGAMIRQVADGKRPMPNDPARRAVYQVQVVRLEAKQEEKRRQATEAAAQSALTPQQDATMNDPSSAANTAKTEAELAAAAAGTPDANMAPATGASEMSGSAMSSDAGTTTGPMEKTSPAEDADARVMENRLYADLEVEKLPDLSPDERYKKILSMPANEQVAFADALPVKK